MTSSRNRRWSALLSSVDMRRDSFLCCLLTSGERCAIRKRQRKFSEKRPHACKERLPTSSISLKHYKCNRRAIHFCRRFGFYATHIQRRLKMKGCRAKLQRWWKNSTTYRKVLALAPAHQQDYNFE